MFVQLAKSILLSVLAIAIISGTSNGSDSEELVEEIVKISKNVIDLHNSSSNRKHNVTSSVFSDVSHFRTKIARQNLENAKDIGDLKPMLLAYINVVEAPSKKDHPGYSYLEKCANSDNKSISHKCAIALAEISAMENDRSSIQRWVIRSTDILADMDPSHKEYWLSSLLTAELTITAYGYDRDVEKALEACQNYYESALNVDVPLNTYTLINNLIVLIDRAYGSEKAWHALEQLKIDTTNVPQEALEVILYTQSKTAIGVQKFDAALEFTGELSKVAEHPIIKKINFGYRALSLAKTNNIASAKSIISESLDLYPEGFENRFGRYLLMAQKEIAISEGDLVFALNIDQKIDRINEELNTAALSQERTRLAGDLLLSNEKFNRERDKLKFDAELSTQKAKSRQTQLFLSLFALTILMFMLLAMFRGFKREQKLNAIIQDKNETLNRTNAHLTQSNHRLGETYRSLKVAHKQAMAGQEAKQKFIGVVGHELRTPLNPIINLASVLEQKTKDTKDRALLKAIKNAGKRLHIIVENMLAISASDKDSRVFIEMVDVVYDVTTIIEEYLPDIKERNQLLRKDGQYLNVNVYKHPDLKQNQPSNKIIIRTIVRNLVDNALKFTKSGDVSLHLRPRKTGRGFEFEIRDTGQGMDISKIDKLMRPFEQAEMGLGRSHEGAGLGLAVVQKYCEQLGAKLDIRSTIGSGTRILIDFPEPAHESETGKLLKVA